MAQATLVNPPIDAGNRFLEEFDKYAPVVVAFWLKGLDGADWAFYIASDRFLDGFRHGAYGEVLRIAKVVGGFDPFQVKLIRLDNRLARAALETYSRHPPKIPLVIHGGTFGGMDVDEVYLVRGPIRSYTMPTGRETLNQIIDAEAAFFQQHGRPPNKMKLPVLLAYDLAKCGRDELGEISGRIFKDGITAFEKDGFHGMNVEIVRSPNATLEFE